ncbi:hypothetical protein [uncultured Desulfosarcina sp.]|uniref:hypothetical protein n=1 Tax=uncultured Desulfosarcina sp. TaxID=218289 RepID=UPI0029C92D7A|nr:hypothetical protein [uncultured Desulfosarcina sp.]
MPEEKRGRIRITRWFVWLFAWWLLAVFFYLFIAAKETRMVEAVTANGVGTVLKSTARAGLPLLERDVQALTKLVREMAGLQGVVDASIVDHKNKIIAFSNRNQLPSTSSVQVNTKEGVGYWNQTLDSGERVVCFSGDINYAGTKIGEVFLVMDAGGGVNLRTIFFWAALCVLVAILFTLLVIDFNGVRSLKAAAKERIASWTGKDLALHDRRELVCPVCGSMKPLNRSFLLEVNLDRYPVLRPAGGNSGNANPLFHDGINLREISRREDLGWLRRQMIHRCADIIKKLAGE